MTEVDTCKDVYFLVKLRPAVAISTFQNKFYQLVKYISFQNILPSLYFNLLF